MKFLFWGQEAQRSVIEMSTERALEKVSDVPTVADAVAAFLTQRQHIEFGGKALNDLALLEERREAIKLALKDEGVRLEFVAGKYDSTQDESIDTFVSEFEALLQSEQATDVEQLEDAADTERLAA